METLEKLSGLYLGSLYREGVHYFEIKAAQWGVEGVRVLRKVILSFFLTFVGVMVLTAGFFIAVVDAFIQRQQTGMIVLSPTMWFGIVLIALTGGFVLWAMSERRWLQLTGIETLLFHINHRGRHRRNESAAHAVNDEKEDFRRMVDEIVEERVKQALRETEKKARESRPLRRARIPPDEALH